MDCKLLFLVLAAFVLSVECGIIPEPVPESRHKRSPDDDDFGDSFKKAFKSASDTVSETVKNAKDKVSESVDNIRNSDAYHSVKERLGDFKGKVEEFGSGLKKKIDDELND